MRPQCRSKEKRSEEALFRGTSSLGVDDKYGQLNDHLNVKYKNHAAVRYKWRTAVFFCT